MFGFYVVPNWHLAADRILYWDKFGHPDGALKNGVNFMRWWFDEAKIVRLAQAMGDEIVLEEDSTSSRPWWVLIVVLLLAGWMLRRYFSRDGQPDKSGELE
jgi:hypothetical protein